MDERNIIRLIETLLFVFGDAILKNSDGYGCEKSEKTHGKPLILLILNVGVYR